MARRKLKQTKAARASRARYRAKKAATGAGLVRKGRKKGKGKGKGKKKGGFLGTLLSIGVPLIADLIGNALRKK